MTTLTNCPNCGAKLKDGIFGTNTLLSDVKSELMAEVYRSPKITGCQKCLSESYDKALSQYMSSRKAVQEEMVEHIKNVPVITSHSPFNWDYNVMGLVTGQSTTGTGLFAEIGASWTDLFGMQSQTYNKKIAAGEDLCLQQLRSKALRMGANAIIAVDIDYSELGAEKGMIMVCMSGTAVKLNNLDVLDPYKIDSIRKISYLADKLSAGNNKYGDLLQGS
ncbi:heavy metal-binding domain-containing protein [Chitinophaga sp. Hz27]|uniref:heavy metal-binding domain-containing protein n=1 Tax=Chitinophaga sp. Hz27 TaxID=3347169 RepID=UPI0035D92B0D